MTKFESTLVTKAVFSKDKIHRYILSKEWDSKANKAMVIMIQPNKSDTIILDLTTVLVINNLHNLGFGAVDIVNLFSKIDTKLSMKDGLSNLIDKDTDKHIIESAKKASTIIVAWGSIGENNKKVKERQSNVLELISDYKDKLRIICDPKGRKGLHPLCPSIRGKWLLEKTKRGEKTTAKEAQKQQKKKNQTKDKGKEQGEKKAAKGAKQDD